jgi:Glycosyltransferase family 87
VLANTGTARPGVGESPETSSTISDVLRRPSVRFAIAAGLAVYIVYYLTGFKPERIRLLVPSVDTSIIYHRGRQIFANGAYPRQFNGINFNLVFPYPPPAVVLFNTLGAFGIRAFIAAWMALMTAGLLTTFRACVAGENDDTQSEWLALGAMALLFCDSPVSWDLRAGNSNLVYIGLILAAYILLRRRPWFAGVLLGLSISLKLYSGLLLLWLVANGPRAVLYAAAIAIVVLWLLMPLAIFGASGTVGLYAGWREQLRLFGGLGGPFFAAELDGPPLVTLRRAIIELSGAHPEAAITRWLLAVSWAIWLAALGWYAARAFKARRPMAPSRAALADWTVLMLAPLPFSPWLEPYHAIPIVPGTILCLIVALDKRTGVSDRIVVAAALVALLAMHAVGIPIPIRGLELMGQFLVLVIAFGLVRPRLAADPMPARPAS